MLPVVAFLSCAFSLFPPTPTVKCLLALSRNSSVGILICMCMIIQLLQLHCGNLVSKNTPVSAALQHKHEVMDHVPQLPVTHRKKEINTERLQKL